MSVYIPTFLQVFITMAPSIPATVVCTTSTTSSMWLNREYARYAPIVSLLASLPKDFVIAMYDSGGLFGHPSPNLEALRVSYSNEFSHIEIARLMQWDIEFKERAEWARIRPNLPLEDQLSLDISLERELARHATW